MRLAVMMPGQGSQFVGMGRDLAATDARAMELFQRADDALGFALSRVCWEGPEDELRRTENAQPAILLHSTIIWSLFPEQIRSRAVCGAGHSLGEFSAYVAAGSLSLEDALRLVRRRGELMATSGDERAGTMAAVIGLDPDGVTEACRRASSVESVVVPANFNAPGQVVISGDVSAVESAMSEATELGARKVMPLNVSGAFHSPLMESAREGLSEAVAAANLQNPSFPVVANATAAATRSAEEASRQLVDQLTSPVRWVESVATLKTERPDLWVELGPGRVLCNLLKRIDRELESMAVGSPEQIVQFVEVCGD
ncbi:MAG: ACP S-malonyltransferase [marine benthic group bacterium]|nr:ACP S-malonyltransferase [Gemmatimonadota bacterium]